MGGTSRHLTANDVKEIVELAFIYGFPMVVGYSVMYEYAIDEKGGQFKAPFNQIFNAARVYTPKDTAAAAPNSDRHTPLFGWTCVPSRWSYACRRWMMIGIIPSS